MAGDQGGTALARVLFGDADARGRLPVTFPQSYGQEQVAGDTDKYPGDLLQNVHYKEGVLVGYRWFDARHLVPAFEFGAGLSYTSFSFGHMKIRPAAGDAKAATVQVKIRNTGRRRGTAVPQVYLGVPGSKNVVQPLRKLAGYAKLSIAARHSKTMKLTIDRRALSYWDTGTHGWRVADGCYAVMLGTSERDIVRSATIAVGHASCPGAAAALPHAASARR
jgi:beta-glucosidase